MTGDDGGHDPLPPRVTTLVVVNASSSIIGTTVYANDSTIAPISAAVASTVTICDVVRHPGIVVGCSGVEKRGDRVITSVKTQRRQSIIVGRY